ncbi:hypothetical protein QAD02_021462 [Eretmocerus hayati]|uniref:Uncharacterized protein n=1 Tax=Eretmocerus hayati TaxID=131215 RepID=A0ACC2PST8_9HYME|nr:hypothetical protein QAD02_021462 [Eretmocerus hayati]
MSRTVEEGFEQATSQNLPKVDLEMFLDFLQNNPNYCSPEIRGVKSIRAARANYGDEAIGRVQLRRVECQCVVRASITPEHKIHRKAYSVTIEIDEKEELVTKAQCHDCVASAGGCKHAVAVLAWLYRRCEEPSPTSVQCYWKKCKLAEVGRSLKGILIKNMVPVKKSSPDVDNSLQLDDLLSYLVQQSLNRETNSQIILDFSPVSSTYSLSMHHLSLNYDGNRSKADEFLTYCATCMVQKVIMQVEKATRGQSQDLLWHELKYGRIGASLLFEAANCKTVDGSLVNRIMGSRIPDTPDMERGRRLEEPILKSVKNTLKCQLFRSGMICSKISPELEASPDAMNKTHVFEVKAPKKLSTFKNYYDKGIKPKYRTQLQLQMLFSGRNLGYFCVADPDFESNGLVNIYEEKLDMNFIKPLMKSASTLWKKCIFPRLIKY